MRALKEWLKQVGPVRHAVRTARLAIGQPRWRPLIQAVGSPPIAPGPPGAPKILIATGGGGYLGATRVESVLAVALAQRGAEPHVLLCDRVLPACFESNINWYPNERRYAKHGPSRLHCAYCHGPAQRMYREIGATLHSYSDYVTRDEVERVREHSDSMPVEAIPGLFEDGIAVGEQAMAGTLRFYARATLGDEHSHVVLRRYLAAARIAALVTDRVCERVGIDRAVLHHGIYVPQGVTASVLKKRGIPLTTWHVAYRKKTFIFSHADTYHHTLMSEPASQWEHMPWSPAHDRYITDYLRSRWHGANDWIHFHRNHEYETAELTRLGVDIGKPIIGLLTNVLWDAQLHYPANAFGNMLEWVLHTIHYFAKRPDLQLVIRVHPAEITGSLPSRQRITEEIAREFPTLPPNVFIVPPESGFSTYTLMNAANAGIIYGTKTGVELAAMGIPVIVAGEAWIRNKGISRDVSSIEEYQRVLDELPYRWRMSEAQIERARKYAFHFFFRRMIPLEFMAPVPEIPGFEMKVDSVDAFRPGRSPGLDIICDGILTGSDFVYPAERDIAST